MKTMLKRFAKDESGATAIEYGLLATLIAVALITAAKSVGGNLNSMFTKVAGNLATN
ncbi:Flp family type IVb pilin [Methylobacterium nodulans]|uniref:Flp/Fap pilin component n=1 Tax=Methylobacterium nodulans (strain LMG 21967 / CNCM I-2342 / ORS 2060) TaxID=460265 RepID=B8IGQ0_METNO|nr:Flp family type IVb pilin [Methylobacterium nodulans]ACL57775.1 Flp/Fap pilin component [Methylobacterium nodulans ORS 2060]